MNPLFSTTQLGRYTLRNRLVMAPMTRSRADAGLIITEGSFPPAMGKGYVRTEAA